MTSYTFISNLIQKFLTVIFVDTFEYLMISTLHKIKIIKRYYRKFKNDSIYIYYIIFDNRYYKILI